MAERFLTIEHLDDTMMLFGNFDENIRRIEAHYHVDLTVRGGDLKIAGEELSVDRAARAVEGLLQLIGRGEQLSEQQVRYVMTLVDEDGDSALSQLSGDNVTITAKGKPIKPKTIGQKQYVEAIRQNTITMGIGPAGTG
ncbi:MAG: PhoH family protein, partial [Clostridia bacterium]|nr:PhoH family protein [Clostridia bacterium]